MIESIEQSEVTGMALVKHKENSVASLPPQETVHPKGPPPKVQVKKNEAGVSMIAPIGGSKAFFEQLNESIGTGDVDLSGHVLNQLAATRSEPTAKDMNTGIAILHGVQPRDPLESLLAVQMTNVHNLAIEFIQRVAAKKDEPLAVVDRYMDRAVKLMGLYSRQLEIFSKYRNRGQQNVVVQHVHVTGQAAIVGTVNRTDPGGQGEGVPQSCGSTV